MNIAVTVDPEIPVPPIYYGGIERIVDLLVRGLMERGYRVMLFANGASSVNCQLECYPGVRGRKAFDLVRNAWHISSRILDFKPDMVHSFSRLAYLAPVLPRAVPKIMTYQRIITARSVSLGEAMARGSLHFTACSRNLMRAFQRRPNWHVIYNGVSAQQYAPAYEIPPDAPLAFLGRVEEIKGPHLAIKAAKRSGRRLMIAGNIPEEAKHKEFFDACIRPHVDGTTVEYLGPVNDREKHDLLSRAAGLLMPILWDEPFGIVMAEALACGTPVIGFRRGSVPEVITDGVNGYVCDSVGEMAKYILELDRVDRRCCRRVFERRFSAQVMLDAYDTLYKQIC